MLKDPLSVAKQLFHSSIHAIDTDMYSAAQQEAWCSTPPDYVTTPRPIRAVSSHVF
ncbi:hypothetical protein [Candidatus Enterovibrio altilux]|uniref:Uncharacterized protein n=1 Tax=Candidatus Enterovibrio altilux TaxID=1927128 RepID=A0A291BB24_9GAMM|nr:hypothetical protein [Candidatus Enterovibrio luxaltus]ATF10206.1 hypothetical protein BTN50_1777 [Candidatus Enterovibrio luxaltus]